MFISIVVPVYNEEGSVGELHRELVGAMEPLGCSYEIVFVDDGSTDGTLDELKKTRPVKIISFTRNFGKSQALQAGFDAAEGEYVITLDGDLQDDPREIPRFIKKAKEGFDVVCGWKQKRADPLSKRTASRFANFVTGTLTGTDIHDMNCCFKLYTKEAARSLELYGDMHRYIPSIVSDLGFSIAEITVHHRPRRYGKTKYGAGRLITGLFDFLTLVFLRKFMYKPMHFFGSGGSILLLAGFSVLSYLSWIKLFSGASIGGRPLLLFGILLVIVGLQILSLGFIGELVIRQRSGRRRPLIKKTIVNH